MNKVFLAHIIDMENNKFVHVYSKITGLFKTEKLRIVVLALFIMEIRKLSHPPSLFTNQVFLYPH